MQEPVHLRSHPWHHCRSKQHMDHREQPALDRVPPGRRRHHLRRRPRRQGRRLVGLQEGRPELPQRCHGTC
ncbi:unnamed protein product [Linum tenue]|uniref:Uncharacterized protein n=1 Tax=Linum tenue TaxID=586396 RepID=A0AAV0PM98_9ROSI|nr:unnamed protein product [Linum tenue]